MPRSTTPAKFSPKPSPIQKPLPLAQPSSVMQYNPPTIGQSIKQGFSVGIGVSLANRMVTSIFGPPTVQPQSVQPTNPTVSAFEQCIAENRDDVAVCAHLAVGQTDIKK